MEYMRSRMRIASAVGIIIGIIIIIIGITGIRLFNTPLESSYSLTTETAYEYYGGDAYSGMQQASADASNNAKASAEALDILNANIKNANDNMLNAISLIIISFGLAVVAFFTYKFVKYCGSSSQSVEACPLSDYSNSVNFNLNTTQQEPDSPNYSLAELAKSISVNNADTWKCNECGDKNPNNAIQCRSCGKYK